MPYNINVPTVDENGKTINQELILHDEIENNEAIGRFITRDAFVNLIASNLNDVSTPDKTMVAFRVNRQILQLMLSFKDCSSLAFCKSQRVDGVETMTIIALDLEQLPLGWNPPVLKSNYEKEKFVALEWIHGINKVEARNSFFRKPNPLDPEAINIEKFFGIL